MSDNNNSFKDFLKELEEAPQPTCNIENPENCESCSGQMSYHKWCDIAPRECNPKKCCLNGHTPKENGKDKRNKK